MLLSKTVKVRMGNTNKRYIIALEKDYKEGEIVEIDIKDLWNGCNAEVLVQCDYCKENNIETTFSSKWNRYIGSKTTSIVKKDSCSKCKPIKIKESNLIKYGVEHTAQLTEVKNRIGEKNKKYNKEYVEKELEKANYKLNSDYINSTTPFNYICMKHPELGEQSTTFIAFLDNKNCCRKCISESKSEQYRKYSLEEVNDIFTDNDCLLINKEYINCHQDLNFICKKHEDLGIQKTTLSQVQEKGYICNYCKGEETHRFGTKHDYKFILKEFSKYGFLLEEGQEYKNKHTKLNFRCQVHKEYIQTASYEQLESSKENICKYCKAEINEEKRLIRQKEVFDKMIKEGMIPTEDAKYYNNKTPINYKCIEHPDVIQHITFNKFNMGRRCRLCGIEKNKGKNHYNWQGGKSDLNKYLRGLLRPIIDEKLKEYNYKCYITGYNGTLEVHHLYNFNKIVTDILEELNLEVKEDIGLYSEEELNSIEKSFIERHQGNWGIPIHPKLHDMFHFEYGIKDNTYEQFEDFVNKHKNILI